MAPPSSPIECYTSSQQGTPGDKPLPQQTSNQVINNIIEFYIRFELDYSVAGGDLKIGY